MTSPEFTLHHGDAFAYLANLSDGGVDHIITDPPYGEATHKGARSRKDTNAPMIHFPHFTAEQFLKLCHESVRVARRWVIMTCEWRHAVLAEESGLPVVRLGCWVKPNGAPQFTGDRPGVGWEAVLLLHREGRKRWNGGGHHAVWTFPIVQGEHPTQKPLPLLKKWLAQFTDAGELICDPLMGAGSTGVAALQTGRRFTGCELDARWFDVAVRRIGCQAMQPQLLLA